MIASTPDRTVLNPQPKTCTHYIRLKISPAAREDAWEMWQTAVRYGGVEVRDCCFAFQSEDRWLMTWETLRLHFGPEYIDVLESDETR